MKKVIAGSLLTVMISNNLVYAEELKDEILDINENVNISTTTESENQEDVNKDITNSLEESDEVIADENKNIANSKEESVEKVTEKNTNSATSVEEVSDFEGLKKALENNASDKIINITADITFTEKLTIANTNKNITINGNGHKFLLANSQMLEVKGEGTKLHDIKCENYSQAISVYNAKNVTLENIELIGDNVNSKVGIDIGASTVGGSSVTMKNITSKNNTDCGIRVKKNSPVTLEGGNIHINDKVDLKVILEKDQADYNIDDKTNQYAEKVNTTESNGNKSVCYTANNTVNVDSFEQLEEAVLIKKGTININNNIDFAKNLEIKNTSKDITINGNNHTIELSNSYKFTVRASNATIKDLEFSNYVDNGLTVYNVTNTNLSNLTFTGNDATLSNDKRSKVGIDIYKSTVTLNNITTANHLYRAIQVRGGSTVDILSKNNHTNDTVHIQTIKDLKKEESDNKINDEKGLYLAGTPTENNDKKTVNYFAKKEVEVSTAKDFIDNLNTSGSVLNIKNDITIKEEDLKSLGDKTELVVSNNIIINGNDNAIDLNKLATVTLKGNDIKLNNLNIKNSKDIGINVYNSKDIVLDEVSVENSTRYGIFVNGSSVKLKNCSTSNNNGGIMITRSRTLRSASHQDSDVEVIGSIKQKESNVDVAVTNLEMVDDGYFQNNKFTAPEGTFNKIENDPEYKVLSDYYLDLFGIEGEARNKKYKEQTTNYMITQTVIDAQNNTEVTNPDGSYVTLAGDGVTDDTENLEKLIEYAALHGREIYFPAGTYKITRDIDLSTINLPALSNFTLSGDKNGLTIFDASSDSEKMLKLKNEVYGTVMNNVNINNIVFNNMGLAFNGPNKKGISLNNNVFMNGKYTREKDASGNITKVTMVPYIEVKNSSYSIEKNVFLRGNDYPGRGISTYRSKNTTVKDNFFGKLEGINDASRMLPSEVIGKLNLINNGSKATLGDNLKVTGSQGNFFTAINNERYDENVVITNNYFNMDKKREINSDFPTDVLVSGINVAADGQRRDHIIYSKGYNGLNIYGNYFEGMENGAAGGVKIRNGKNTYIGSNHLKDVPVLTYIYGDLTREECVLYDTTIYNNLFHNTTNFGGEGTGILYYQSYRDGDTLEFKSGGVVTDTWTDAYGDVKNFLVYNNKFMSDDRDLITISGRAKTAYNNNEFLAHGNKYVDNDMLVNYRVSGNFALSESLESDVLSKVNDGYKQYKDASIPLTPATVDYKYLNEEIDKANTFYEEIEKNNLIGELAGQYPQDIAKELKDLLLETTELIKSNSLNQWDTNRRLTLVQETLEKLKSSVNPKEEYPEITGLDNITIKAGETFDPMDGVVITDNKDTIDQMKVNVELGNFDNNVPGNYTIKYIIEDSDGNKTIATREITVINNNKPVISGIDSVTIKVGDTFDPINGVIATDVEDGDLTDKIIVLGNVDTTKAGEYTITYQVTDSDNNTTEHIRTIIVEDNNNNNNNNTSNNDKDHKHNELTNSENPKTGDNILIWLLVGIMSLFAITFVDRKKQIK